MTRARFGHTVIRASAGTGKTWRLGNRYIGLLAAGAAPESVVAATFSRKAAGEILHRVLTRLARASLDDDAGAALGRDLGEDTFTSETAAALLRRVTRSLHRVRVCTLDSFFADIARGFGPELGLPPGWDMAEEDDTQRLRVESIDGALREYELDALIALLAEFHDGAVKQSVVHGFDDVVKTLHGVHGETEPEVWGAISLVGASDPTTLARAADALRAMSLNNKPIISARDKVLRELDGGDWEALVTSKLLRSQAAGEPFNKKVLEPAEREACAVLFRHAQAAVVEAIARRTRSARTMLDVFDVRYRELQRTRRLLRFEDVARAIGDGALGSRLDEVFMRLDGRTEHVLLDEFQDTSPAQWRVLRPFAEVAVRDGSLFVVGDVKQAIYGWRGGVAEIFDAVQAELPGLGEESLEKSQRSSPVIIDVVNRVFERVGELAALKEHHESGARWAKRFRAHTTAREGFGGYVRVVTAPAAEEADGQGEATLDYAARCVQALAAAHPGRSIGVLARSNEAVAALTDRLRALDVAVSGEGTSPLTSSRAVEAMLALLQLADHPGDTIAGYHVARSPLGAVVGFTAHDRRDAARRLSAEVRQALVADGYGACLYRWTTGVAPSCDARDLRWLLKLVELGYEYDGAATLRPGDFVAWVKQRRVPDAGDAPVRVMNIHQSKGLQFDVVVLPELGAQLVRAPAVLLQRESPLDPITAVSLPAKKDLLEGTPLDPMRLAAIGGTVVESLNLLYVALTRAVHALHLIVAPDGDKPKRTLSMAEIVRATLYPDAELTPDSLIFEHGDVGWFRAPALTAAPTLAEPLRLSMKPSARHQRLERQRPSSQHGAAEATLSAAFAPPNRAALEQGTLIHAFFERVEWLDDGPPDRAALLRVARASGYSAAESERKVDWFEDMLWWPAVRRVMGRSGYQVEVGDVLEVRREFPFTQREGDSLINGIIDRLVLHRRGGKVVAADVIDFKTDAVDVTNEATIAARVEFHRGQMEAYRRAVSRMEGVAPDRVRSRLLFVTAGVVREV